MYQGAISGYELIIGWTQFQRFVSTRIERLFLVDYRRPRIFEHLDLVRLPGLPWPPVVITVSGRE
jgi:hypothetical protein